MIRLKLYAERANFGRFIDIAITHDGPHGLAVGQPIVMQTVPMDEWPPSAPALRLHPDDAQTLMDELWRCGLRPTEGTGSAGSLAATQRHLDDMRAIAMGLLKGDL